MCDNLSFAIRRKYIWNFFFGKKETLAQSLVDGAIKAVFSGLIVAAVGSYVLGAVENRIELASKRAALQDYRNATLSQTLEAAGTSFTELHCARNELELVLTECGNQLKEFTSILSKNRELLKAIFPDSAFPSIGSMIEITNQMISIKDEVDLSIQHSNLVEKFSNIFTIMIQEVSSHFN